jgi:hypothetical protein
MNLNNLDSSKIAELEHNDPFMYYAISEVRSAPFTAETWICQFLRRTSVTFEAAELLSDMSSMSMSPNGSDSNDDSFGLYQYLSSLFLLSTAW